MGRVRNKERRPKTQGPTKVKTDSMSNFQGSISVIMQFELAKGVKKQRMDVDRE